ncbi:efflux RND transporter periplasmic adaptor subunit [Flavobacterium sp. HJJ]|uniref:efflux RND transporter periplasmic adaptor subunit n=1 Tax=Flavobacterium sp. HJJ TaxID=2783792 RepID=UPI00188A5174|nr:efflux RND transporter periplasmic adaptor subunit [Flavobacterium sp. HJJ]MBF4472121.1 efflux RND transporter periplasmic adaptor subunit [Flavobacterium sp. HJJ]
MKTQKFILLIIMSTLFSCAKKQAESNLSDVIAVKTQKIRYESYAPPIVSGGIITSDKETRLSFKIGGIIDKLYVDEGQLVSKGQLLGILNQTEISAQLQQAKNDLDKAQRNHKRIENLHKDNAATAEEFENSVTSLNSAQQLYDIARFNKQYASIYANQSGNVIKKEMNEGEMASPGSPVFTINASSNNNWIIIIGLSDKDWVRVKKGDKAIITTDAYGDKKFTAVVSEIGAAADPQTGTFLVKLKIDPRHYKFANGLAAKIAIYPSQKEMFYFIPVSAMVQANELSGVVYSVNRDQKSVQKHIVKIAFIETNRIAIRSGLENVKSVITDGASYLSSDSKIKL